MNETSSLFVTMLLSGPKRSSEDVLVHSNLILSRNRSSEASSVDICETRDGDRVATVFHRKNIIRVVLQPRMALAQPSVFRLLSSLLKEVRIGELILSDEGVFLALNSGEFITRRDFGTQREICFSMTRSEYLILDIADGHLKRTSVFRPKDTLTPASSLDSAGRYNSRLQLATAR